jgi:hypothetical protein
MPAHRLIPLFVLLVLSALPLTRAEAGLWGDLKRGAAEAIDKGKEAAGEAAAVTKEVAGKAAEKGGAFVSDTKDHFHREGTPDELRAQSDDLAYRAMDRLFVDDPEAHALFDRCFGYAVFEMRQVSFGVTAGYGYGVARERESDIPTYMKMATGGAGYSLGIGGFAFQLVLLFEDEASYRRFLVEGVEGRAEAATLVGDQTEYLAREFREGLAVYKLTKQGFKVSAGLVGMRFWADEDLNQPWPAPAVGIDAGLPPPVAEQPGTAIEPEPESIPVPPADPLTSGEPK